MRGARIVAGWLLLLSVVAGTNTSVSSEVEYPSRPITLIVPFAAGGPTDVTARAIAQHMTSTLGQPIVIENVAGAGGTTGALRTMRSTPNGYAIMIGHLGTHAAAVSAFPNLGYNPSTDFAPIGMISEIPVLILARKDLPPNTAAEFFEYVKAAPLRMAHAGTGSVSHSFCTYLNNLIGAEAKLIAFNGTGPAMRALVAGEVDYMCDQIVTAVPQLEEHEIKAYAITSRRRSPSLPDVPTSQEVGLSAFQGNAWNALFAPKGIKPELVTRLNAALGKALDDETTRGRLIGLGSIIPQGDARSPQALAAFVKSEIARLQLRTSLRRQ